MKRLLGIALAFFFLGAAPAFATCTTLQLKDNAGATPNALYRDDGAGNCLSSVVISNAGSTATAGVTTNGLKVDGTATTQPVSAASLPLPTGAATAAKQPALGTAGAASSDVITIQGVTSMTPVKVDGSAVTQPVSAAASAIANGASVAQGSTTDSPCTLPATGTGCSQIAIEKAIANAANSPATLAAAATGGCTPGVILSAASNNSTSIKGSAGTLCELTIIQTTTTLMDVRLYDTASAPTCSSATGVVANYVAQSNATSPGMTIPLGPFGKAFASGIGICITGANSNSDNTNAATGLNVNYSFK